MSDKHKMTIIRCYYCQQRMQVPTDEGKLKVTCPNCGEVFEYQPKHLDPAMMRGKIIKIVVTLVIVFLSSFVIYGIVQKNKISVTINDAWNSALDVDDEEAFIAEIDKLTNYSIDKIRKHKGYYNISMIVEGPNVKAVIEKEQPDLQSLNRVAEYLLDAVHRAPIEKTETKIYATKEDSQYSIKFSDEFIDAMSGKLYLYSVDELFKAINR